MLDTVGGRVEELARERSAGALAVAAVTLALKVTAGVLALALARPVVRRAAARLALGAGAVLVLYGGVLVVVGALVLAGAIDPSTDVDERALRWHVFFWDLWFAVWGVALIAAARRATASR